MKFRKILLLIVCVSILSACQQNQLSLQKVKKAKTWPITLLVTGKGGNATMKVNTGPMQGCINTQNGCMVFFETESGVVTFDMSGNHEDFHITELKLCKGITPPEPLSADCTLGDNADDFYVVKSEGGLQIPHKNTGKIEWSYDDAIKTFVLHDQNTLTQKYYYMVTACDGADPATRKCVTADPPLDNKG